MTNDENRVIGTVWLDESELSDGDRSVLDTALANYEKDPDAGSDWEEVKARIRAELARVGA